MEREEKDNMENEQQPVTLRKVDGEITVVTTVETTASISVAEYDRQIAETEERLKSLKKARKSIADFEDSDEDETEVTL